MRRSSLIAAAAVAALAAFGSPGSPQAFVADDYDPGEAQITNSWFDTIVLAPGSDAAAAFAPALRADRDYVQGMRPHHAGALTMSQAYLRDPQARNPTLRRLAEAIIVNQAFEIALLDDVARQLEQPVQSVNLGLARLAMRPAGTEGLGQTWRFMKAPAPGPLSGGGEVTERDVRFAKAMIIHHDAALDMARAYQTNPAAQNNFIGLLNVQIVTDQSQEIAVMRHVVASFTGNADAVRVDPSDVHGMDGHMAMPGGMAQPGVQQQEHGNDAHGHH